MLRSKSPSNAAAASPCEPSPCWFLEGMVDDGDSAPSNVPLLVWPFRVGRRREASLCLPSVSISKEHAELDFDGTSLWVRDLGSTNGTFVNGVRVTEAQRIKNGDLLHFANLGFRLRCGDASPCSATAYEPPGALISAACQFDHMFDLGIAVPYYQPIVSFQGDRALSFEVLAHSQVEGMEEAKEIFLVASRLKLADELSRFFRSLGVAVAEGLPRTYTLFLNTHPSELHNSVLLDSLKTLREKSPDRPLTLEIHEAAVTDPLVMKELRAVLNDLHIGLAYDDFGTGQDRLLDLIEVPPDYLKFDARFVRDLHTAPKAQQQMVRTLVGMARDLGIAPLAEAVETAEESAICKELGFEFGQGYYYGRPMPIQDLLKFVGAEPDGSRLRMNPKSAFS